MNILKFVSIYPDEQSCRDNFKDLREKEGVICKKCKTKTHYWLKNKEQWQCTGCGFRTTLRSGTIMQASKLPIRTWYLAMAFMSFTKKGISASELQRQLDHSRYDTIWALMHKIRTAMGLRDSLYELKGSIEMDEGFFSIATPKGTKLKRGKGSQKQKNVAVLAESIPLEDIETGEKTSYPGYYKMKVLETQKAESINQYLEENINDMSIVFSDKSKSYVDISDFVEAHYTEESTKETTNTTLKWVHIAISNAKRNFLGVYHKIEGKYLQLYLNEFCYKLNRRYFGNRLFDRLSIALACSYWYVSG